MARNQIIPVVEGDGDTFAVPNLISSILRNVKDRSLIVGKPKNAHGATNLKKSNGIESFVKYAWMEPNCAGVLVILDSDDDCPVQLAESLALRIRTIGCRKPTVIVAAAKEYESWFLASCGTLTGIEHRGVTLLPKKLVFTGDPDSKRGAKEWINKQLPRNTCYKETVHQLLFTRKISHQVAATNSRSFRRMLSAIDKLREAIANGENSFVSP